MVHLRIKTGSPAQVSKLAETNIALYRQNCLTQAAPHWRSVGSSDVRQHVGTEAQAPIFLSFLPLQR